MAKQAKKTDSSVLKVPITKADPKKVKDKTNAREISWFFMLRIKIRSGAQSLKQLPHRPFNRQGLKHTLSWDGIQQGHETDKISHGPGSPETSELHVKHAYPKAGQTVVGKPQHSPPEPPVLSWIALQYPRQQHTSD